jgi:hypothetical protein
VQFQYLVKELKHLLLDNLVISVVQAVRFTSYCCVYYLKTLSIAELHSGSTLATNNVFQTIQKFENDIFTTIICYC